jgi:hypothetical protein
MNEALGARENGGEMGGRRKRRFRWNFCVATFLGAPMIPLLIFAASEDWGIDFNDNILPWLGGVFDV